MLSYRHAYHAGNHADVFKHLVLTLLMQSLLKKEKPFFILDTHAGAGRYHLGSEMARKNREFASGIERLWEVANAPEAIGQYLDAVRTTNPGRELRWYPGSPRIFRHFLRPQDRLVLSELHPNETREISREFAGDRQVRVEAADGYQTLKAQLPPKERRGLVHIDPAYELKDERRRVLEALADAHRRWATGIVAVWYPIQDRATADDFLRRLKKLGLPEVLVTEFCVMPEEAFRLTGSGMIIVNPPWQLDEQLRQVLPWLSTQLGVGGQSSWRVEGLVSSKAQG
jgi:23S rRNA (adenine2030-N6)-methyltransferase